MTINCICSPLSHKLMHINLFSVLNLLLNFLLKLVMMHNYENLCKIDGHNCTVTVDLKCPFNTLRPRQNGRYFADDIFKCIFLNKNVWILTKISLKFVPKGPINNISSLVQIIVWRRPGAKPLSEPMMVSLLTHILGLNELKEMASERPWS